MIPVRPGSRDGDLFRMCSHVCRKHDVPPQNSYRVPFSIYYNETTRNQNMSNTAHAAMVWATDELWDLDEED